MNAVNSRIKSSGFGFAILIWFCPPASHAADDFAWQQDYAKVIPSGDIQWAPRKFQFTTGNAIRYIDFESGDDAKVLAVPLDKLCKTYRHVQSFRDLPGEVLNRISHFFEHYKDLDEGKWVRVEGWGGIDEAKQEIMDSVQMYQDAPEKPHF